MRSRSLTDEELRAILGAMPRMYQVICLTMFYLGVRVSEALDLTRGDVKAANGEIRENFTFAVLKKRKQQNRVRPVPPELRKVIKDWTLEQFQRTGFYADDTPLFTRFTRKKAVSPLSVWREMKKAAERAGIDPRGVSCHSMRKTFCRLMMNSLNKTAEAKENRLYAMQCMREILGHNDIRATQAYIEPVRYDLTKFFPALENAAGKKKE